MSSKISSTREKSAEALAASDPKKFKNPANPEIHRNITVMDFREEVR